MKRILAVALVFIHLLTLNISSVYAESEYSSFSFEPRLLSAADVSASDWYETEEMRALFCATAAMDIVLQKKDEYSSAVISALYAGCSYMAKDGFTLSAYYFGEEQAVLLFYVPLTGECEVVIREMSAISLADFLMAGLKRAGNITSYYAVENSDILSMMKLVIETLV